MRCLISTRGEAFAILKITNIEGQKQFRVVVEGRLVAPWTRELRPACEKAWEELHGRELIVELKHLVAISQEAENILVDLMNRGVKVCGSGVFTKQILKHLARRARTNSRDATG
jgi:hypothetical protein